ncbi:MAG: hypothetical protein FD123_1275 [Bacteroidetes bacterium]|nr:MAG: hypothetical protein FD123_1275 [Bacteroidota bacterium]
MKKITLWTIALFAGVSAHTQTVPNAGFENWSNNTESSTTYLNPQSWITIDVVTSFFNDLFGSPNLSSAAVSRVSSAHSGNYAVRMGVSTNTAGDTVSGAVFSTPTALSLVDAVFGGQAMGYPFTFRPAALTGYYTLTSLGGDQAGFQVLMTKWNSSTSSRDTIADVMMYVNAASNWTLFSVPLTYQLNAYPDTMLIVAGVYGIADIYHIGTQFTIDDLLFTGTVPIGVEEQGQAAANVSVFPNPFRESATFRVSDAELKNARLEIFDVLGNKVRVINNLSGNSFTIDQEGLGSGVYFYQLISEEAGIASGKLVVE